MRLKNVREEIGTNDGKQSINVTTESLYEEEYYRNSGALSKRDRRSSSR
jgi:hypothetical protein